VDVPRRAASLHPKVTRFPVNPAWRLAQQPCESPVRQCAWCNRIEGPPGRYDVVATQKLRDATHGICPECKDRWLAAAASSGGYSQAA